MPKSICLISQQPYFSLHKQICQLVFKNVVLHNNSKSLESLTEHHQNRIQNIVLSFENDIRDNPSEYLLHQLEFYVSIVLHHLRINSSPSRDTEVVLHKRQIKTLFCGPAKQMVQCEEKSEDCLFRFRSAGNARSVFTLDNYPFESLLQKLSP